MNDTIIACDTHVVPVDDQTRWIFVRLRAASGLTGAGEASLNGREDEVLLAARALTSTVIGLDAGQPRQIPRHLKFDTLPRAAFVSAVSQAMWDISAQAGHKSVAQELGGLQRTVIPLYANINRRTRDRSPRGFAAIAAAAQAQGYSAFKLAPFDPVSPGQDRRRMRAGMEHGLACLAAVREQVGPGARLMVDCHWRFDEKGAQALIDAAAGLGLYWIECPIQEDVEHLPALLGLRRRANRNGIRLAGCENMVRTAGFKPYAEAGAYDVMMPDVKYAGGMDEMLAIADLLERHDIEFSPHNPTGPVCHAASIHVCAAARAVDALEIQFDESPLFDQMLVRRSSVIINGEAHIDAAATGLGIALDEARLNPYTAP